MNKETLIAKIESRIQALEYMCFDEENFYISLPESEITLALVSKAKMIRLGNESSYLNEILEDLQNVQI